MKKVLTALLAIIYLTTTMGATLYFHYCMGTLVSWGLTNHAGNTCQFCGMQMKKPSGEPLLGKNNCCHEECKQVRNDIDQKSGREFLQVTKVVFAAAGFQRSGRAYTPDHSRFLLRHSSHGPPLAASVPVYLRICDFRI